MPSKEQRQEYQQRYYEKTKEIHNQRSQQWAKDHPEAARGQLLRYRMKKRILAITGYGGICACCHEDNLAFLCIDHIDGGGREHRESINAKNGTQFYAWLIKEGFPPGFQVLCANCNMAKHYSHGCPHQDSLESKTL